MTGYIRGAARGVAALEIWPVAALVAASLVSERALLPALGAAAVFWLVRLVAYERPGIPTPADWPVVLLLLMLPVTLWVTPVPDITRTQVYRLLAGIALYYAMVNWARTRARLKLLVAGSMLAGLLLALAAPFMVRWSTVKFAALIPASFYEQFVLKLTDAVNPNVMGGQLVILLPLALAAPLFGGWRRHWPLLLPGLLIAPVMAGMLLLTQSRGALLALVAALMALVLLRWRHGWLLLLTAATAGTIALQYVDTTRLLEFVSSNQTVGSLGGRVEIWSRAVYMIQDFPFTGIGMGAFPELTGLTYPLFLVRSSADHAHNLLLQVAVDLGLPGLIAWLAILMLVCVAAWQVYRRGRAARDGWLAGLGAGLLACQVALVTHGLTDAVTWGMVRPAPLVWGLWGLTMAAWYVSRVVTSDE